MRTITTTVIAMLGALWLSTSAQGQNPRPQSMDGSIVDFSVLGPWTVTWQWMLVGGRSCKAVGRISDEMKVGILNQMPPVTYRGGQWFIWLTHYEINLPEDTVTPAEIVAEGGVVRVGELLAGEPMDVGGKESNRRGAWAALFEFPQADAIVPFIREGKALTVRGDQKLFSNFQVSIDAAIVRELDRCIDWKPPAPASP